MSAMMGAPQRCADSMGLSWAPAVFGFWASKPLHAFVEGHTCMHSLQEADNRPDLRARAIFLWYSSGHQYL